ncbi:MAG: O-methyltransferase [Tissierellia bacterium]|nr:O-methyltransferase [Tissierellia bacterium]
MNNIGNEIVTEYIDGLYKSNGKSKFIEELRDYGEEKNIPIIRRDVQEFIKTIIRIYKPKKILEIGTAIGFSSILFAKYTDDDADITTLEINEDMYNIAQNNIQKYGFENKIKVVLGDALETMKKLDGKDYDMVFIDAAKGQYIQYLNLVLPILSEKAIILSDNILYKGMIADENLVTKRNKTIVKRIRKYLDLLLNSDDIHTSILPIGDGLAISYKEDK